MSKRPRVQGSCCGRMRAACEELVAIGQTLGLSLEIKPETVDVIAIHAAGVAIRDEVTGRVRRSWSVLRALTTEFRDEPTKDRTLAEDDERFAAALQDARHVVEGGVAGPAGDLLAELVPLLADMSSEGDRRRTALLEKAEALLEAHHVG